MKKALYIILYCFYIILFVNSIFSSKAFSSSNKKIEIEKYYDERIGKYVDVAAGEILVKFKPSVSAKSINNLNKTNQIDIVRNIPEIKVHRLSQSGRLNKIPVNDLLKAYKKDPSVEYAEPNFIVHHMATVPNDTSYSLQWGLQNISAEAGWDIERGSLEVTIAVIDTGMNMSHEDLSGKIWSNSAELSGITGIDDDGNGYVDDRYGWDFVATDNNPDDLIHGHGTHVAGIAAASSNNNKGIAGVSWNSKIMVLRVLDSTGAGYTSDIILGITYAANNGAKVINLSLGSYSSSYLQNEAIQYAHGRGCVIAAAAGNDGNTTISYPASYNNVISVASIKNNNVYSSFSNYNYYVDVCAPGGDNFGGSGDIYSSIPTNTYGYKAGTSMATPFVAGLAALIFSRNPTWTNSQVEDRIFSSVTDLGPSGWDSTYGYGKINVWRALKTAPSIPTGLTASAESGKITLSWNANIDPGFIGYKIYRSTAATGTYSLLTTKTTTETAHDDNTVSNDVRYYYKITAYDADLESFRSNAVSAIIDTIPPTGTISINAGSTFSRTAGAILALSATDAGGISQMKFSNDNNIWSTAETYATLEGWILTAGDGNKTVYAKFKDSSGNWSTDAISDSIILDYEPSGTIMINSGEAYATTNKVTLTLTASSDVVQMKFSSDNNIWSAAENYSTAKKWILDTEDGNKTVYVNFKDSSDWGSATFSDIIILDTTAPSGTISINGAAAYATTTEAVLTLTADNDVVQMKFSNDNINWQTEENYTSIKNWILASGDGNKTVYVKFKDIAGNWSDAAISDIIILDTISPNGTIIINQGEAYTSTTEVIISLSAPSDTVQMKFSIDNIAWSAVEDYSAAKPWTLTSEDGLKTVFAMFKDISNHWSVATISDSIILDTAAPSGTISINAAAAYSSTREVTLTLTASGDVFQMKFSSDNINWSAEENYSASKNWTLTSGDGNKTVYAKFRDLAGNWSKAEIKDTINLLMHLYASGTSMITTPFNLPLGQDIKTTFNDAKGLQLAYWDPSLTKPAKYRFYPDPILTSLNPGKGYFVKISDPAILNTGNGTLIPTTESYEIGLNLYWNMIGSPFLTDILWNNVKVRLPDNRILTMDEAINADIIKSGLWGYDNNSYQLSGVLGAWKGYWVKIVKPCYLVFSPSAPLNSLSKNETSDIKIETVCDGGPSDSIIFGSAKNAGEGYDKLLDIEKPPLFSPYLTAYFPHTDWGSDSGNYGVDIRNLFDNEKIWDFEIKSDMDNAAAVIRLAADSSIPKDHKLFIKDLSGATEKEISRGSSYSFNLGAPGTAQRFQMRLLNNKLLQAGNLTVNNLINYPNPVNPDKDPIKIKYDLGEDADVTIKIFSSSGELIKSIFMNSGSPGAKSGTNTVTWNGINDYGFASAGGVYFYLLKAKNASGDTSGRGKIAIWRE